LTFASDRHTLLYAIILSLSCKIQVQHLGYGRHCQKQYPGICLPRACSPEHHTLWYAESRPECPMLSVYLDSLGAINAISAEHRKAMRWGWYLDVVFCYPLPHPASKQSQFKPGQELKGSVIKLTYSATLICLDVSIGYSLAHLDFFIVQKRA
jgi:hypothetical protein